MSCLVDRDIFGRDRYSRCQHSFESALMKSHAIAAIMLLAPAALCAAEPDVATTIRLRQDGPSIAPEDAKGLTPQALGDVLLAPGHPPVTEVAVGAQGMDPPTPPDSPVRVKLYLEPASSEQTGFCQRIIATVYLDPAGSSKDAGSAKGRPNNLSTETAYRWSDETRKASACSAPKFAFFIPRPGEQQQALEAVRLLASARRAARQGTRLSFPVSIEDKEGPEMLAYQRRYPQRPRIAGLRIMRDAKKALASLPVDAVTFAGPSSTAGSDLLHASDLVDAKRPSLRGMTIFLGGDWVVGLAIAERRIFRMRLLRQIPPPF
ncbi:MAG: hypothetical protein ABI471_08420 [Sphingomonas bacterium]